MSLFDIPKPQEKVVSTSKGGTVVCGGLTTAFTCRANQKLKDVMPEILPDITINYASLGDWSAHDLLFYLLNITGSANVFFTTWAISEFAIRQLHSLVESGMIIDLKGIYDYRNGTHKTGELEFLRKFTSEIKAAKIHAKVCVI